MKAMAVMSGLKVLVQRAWLPAVLLKVFGLSSVNGPSVRRSADIGFDKRASEAVENVLPRDHFGARAGSRWIGICLFAFVLLSGAANTAQAAEKFCSDFPGGVIDGFVDAVPTQITVDTDCTFLNFPASNPLTATINFQTTDPTIYLIIFNNVVFTGNMACASIDHRLWFVNGSDYGSGNKCQDLFIPAESIIKENPVQPSASIGVPFTYTLTLPALQILGDPSLNDLHTVTLWDDLTATGADLTFVSINAYDKGTLAPVTLVPETNPLALGGVWTPKNLSYEPIPLITAGTQIVVEITVVLDDTAANTPGTQFINTAKWVFGRLIEGVFYDPLPGEYGVTPPMTIAEPDLVVTKSSPDTALNLGIPASFTIDVQNNGGSDAWNATIIDEFPDGPFAGTCDFDPTTGPGFSAQLFQADGVTPVSGPLIQGVDFTATYDGFPQCDLTLTMLTAAAVIGPTQRLIINYQTELDGTTTADNVPLTNVAGATEWFSGDGILPRRVFNRILTDGTPGTIDHEDSYTLTTGLSGYFFQKTVQNLTTGENPGITAAPGDRLAYRLRVFNVDQIIDNITITDILDPSLFNTGTSFTPVSLPPGAAFSFDNVTGVLQVFGNLTPLNLSVGTELIIDFEINLAAGLVNNTVVPNQANLVADGPLNVDSDDPFVNGIADPTTLPYNPDTTNITIQTPGPLLKANSQASAVVGEQFTFTITVPEIPVDVPLYDVRILDDLALAGVDLGFVSASVVSGGTWSLINTGSATSLVIEDVATGIDIPANGQAVIEITVELLNTLTNQRSLTFNNRADFTYNRANGVAGTLTNGMFDTTANMTVFEPEITVINKTVSNATPTAGEIVRYAITLTAGSGAGFSDVFDVTLNDFLDLGLVYAGNPTVTVGGGVSADNSIIDPATVGDGIVTPQTLLWTAIEADIDIVAGTSVVIEYDVQVLGSVLANTTLSNGAIAQWTSIDGVSIGDERNGSDGIGGLNDYITSLTPVIVTTPDINATITKVRANDTFGAADNNVRIGDIVEYTLTLSMPEGTLGNLELVDTLPQGLDFEGIVSINGNIGPAPYTAVAPFAHADIAAANVVEAGDPALGPTTVTWTLGAVTNLPVDNLANDFVIVYRARVMNSVLAQNDPGIPLNNTVVMAYDTAAGTVTQSDLDTIINVLQPNLTVSKTANPAGGDIIIDASELVDYTVDIVNSGTAPAYDLVLQDIIPVGMRNGVATVTMVSTELVVAGTVLANPVFSYDNATGLVIWDLDTGVANTYTVPAGDTLRIVYQVQVEAGIGAGLALSNAAQGTVYYSFDDEAVPTLGTVTGIREIYAATNVASTTLYTGAPPRKALISPAPANPEATIGEEVVYRITVPGTLSSSTLYDIQITDTLDANLEFVSATVTGGIGVTNNSTITPSVMDILVAEIPAGQQVVIDLRARIRNILTAQQGVAINNTASYTYAYAPAGTPLPALTSSDIVTVNIIEPQISIGKTVTPVTPVTSGDVLSYTLNLTASGAGIGDQFSDAFDASIIDNLSLGLAYVPGTATVNGAGNTITDPVIVGDGVTVAQTLTWQLADATADIDIVEGTIVTVQYDVLVLDGVLPGQTLINSAVAQWTGIDGVSAVERNGSNVPVVNDYFTAPVTASLITPDTNAFLKSRLTDTFGIGDANVRIGDMVEYELRLTLQEGTSANVVLTDTLPQGLAFAGVAQINGDTVAPYVAVAPFGHADLGAPVVVGDPTVGPSTLTWTIGDVSNAGDSNPANDNFVIRYYARVLDNVLPQTPTAVALNNTANFAYDNVSGTVNLPGAAGLTLQQPLLAVGKLAAPANGDTILEANEIVTYTIDVVNTGAAPAYDVVLQDTIPVGLRNGALTITTDSIDLLSGTSLPVLAPAYSAVTGVALWDFGAGAYTIPAGDTLRIVYRVQADADLGTGLQIDNLAVVPVYYSFDDATVPTLGGVAGVREIYGPTNTAVVPLTSAGPNPLDKQNTVALASVGEPFSYRVIIPAVPQTTALNDVRILDDLTLSAADLSFVSVTKISGSLPWTPVNSGNATSLVIEDTVTGIDIPAGEQIEIEITVVLTDTPANVSGLPFNNTADYTYNRVNNDAVSQAPGLPDTTADMTIVGPDVLTLEKSGPATMRVGTPGTFTLNIHNIGTSPAFDATIVDILPNPVPGGMCDAVPTITSAQLFQADGITPVGVPLVLNTDYTMAFVPGTPTCSLTLTMLTVAAAIPVDNRLIFTYEASLDADSANNTPQTNIAGVRQWFSADTAGAGATGSIRTYTGPLTDGTPLVLDSQDAFTLLTEQPIILFQKTVINMTTGQNPGANASPGDVLRYRIVANNVSPVNVPLFSIVDEIDSLNASVMYAPGTLTIISAPATADTSNTDPVGGAAGTGLLDVRNLVLDPQGGANDTVVVEFDVTLAPAIDSGTLVLNQAQLVIANVPPLVTDDPNVNGVDDPVVIGDEDPTQTLIASAPLFDIYKTATDLTGAPLLAGETLRYTITVKNIGSEDSVNSILRDQIPANTTYVANSTRLNGAVVADPAVGISALVAGVRLNAPENTTSGFMRADASATINNIATITFDVVINLDVVNGAIISNQGFFNASGAGNSGPIAETPSDDPATVAIDDPTRVIVGNLPLIDSQKTVVLIDVGGSTPNVVDPGDTLRYTITVTNFGAIPATGVSLMDAVPADTSYLEDTVFLNGLAVARPDGGVSPLISGIDISSSDLTPPLPAAGNGQLSPGGTATIIFDVQVNTGVVAGTIISNQGEVSSNELPVEPTDADGIDSNGDQPTLIAVGNVQLLAITKEVFIVGGSAATAGGQLEYVVRATNIGLVPATNVVLTDNLDLPVAGQMTYVAGSGNMNGLPQGVSFAAPVLTADYAGTYGLLMPGGIVELRFRVDLDAGLLIGDAVTNTGRVDYGVLQFATATVSIDVGGTPGSANLNGSVWHDSNFDDVIDPGESLLESWTVEIYRNGAFFDSVQTDASGNYSISGLAANNLSGDNYQLRFVAPNSGPNTASLGYASSGFTNESQRISNISVASGNNALNLNLPIEPNGVVYDSILRVPVVGATLTLLQSANGLALPGSCFDDPVQQNQITLAGGFYKFDLNFSQAECPPGGDYVIDVSVPASGYVAGLSVAIPPQSATGTLPFNVPACVGGVDDVVPSTVNHCEVQTLSSLPPLAVPAQTAGTNYQLHLTLDSNLVPGESQLFNNHIPLDPVLGQVVSISKISPMVNVTRGELVPYTIAVSNTLQVPLSQVSVVDDFPAGFKYVKGSARVNGVPVEPVINGLSMSWDLGTVGVNVKHTVKMLLIVGAGVQEGAYVNRAHVYSNLTQNNVSGEASASVRVVPDPTFDCSDIIGKVFDDKNLNGYQDSNEPGIAGVRLATARGLLITTDHKGRYHVTCAAVPNEQRGSNFIIKLDERTLPSGFRITTENPRVQKVTRGKLSKFNFGATIHRVVTIDVADGVFLSDDDNMRPQWESRLGLLIEELRKAPSVLRITYLADVESKGLVKDRIDKLVSRIIDHWKGIDSYRLNIETEIFWRHGKPVDDGGFD